MSQVIEPAKLLGPLLGCLEDVSQNLRSDWPTSLTDKRLMPRTLQSRKQRKRFCTDVFCSIEENLLVEHGLPGEKAVSHIENSEVCNAPNFAHQRHGRVTWRCRNDHAAHLRWEAKGDD
ncbi:hypothetical protein [Variovorax paradoxus]|uniref:hypothetical protein n=1 Tax=Variovorax paradoxus TaxID=34073 RepID=UPI0012BB5CF2|nr:hypothetical protein [Variovorax paradoxus]